MLTLLWLLFNILTIYKIPAKRFALYYNDLPILMKLPITLYFLPVVLHYKKYLKQILIILFCCVLILAVQFIPWMIRQHNYPWFATSYLLTLIFTAMPATVAMYHTHTLTWKICNKNKHRTSEKVIPTE